MKFKIGTTWYDSEHHPLLVFLTPEEKSQIANMPGFKFCSFPDGEDPNSIEIFTVPHRLRTGHSSPRQDDSHRHPGPGRPQ